VTIEFDSRCRYVTDWPSGEHTLIVGLLAWVGNSAEQTALLVDTACAFCVVSSQLARDYGWEPSDDLEILTISTRLGTFEGVIDRIDVTFRGADHSWLAVDCTWIIIDDWTGPTVLGWKGCLERFKFHFEPLDNWFYFGSL
jgi:hypothetical protein